MLTKEKIIKVLKKPTLVVTKTKRLLDNNTEDIIKYYTRKSSWYNLVNHKEIRVAGLKRTGNHAVINWIKNQMNGEIWFLNNVNPNENPYRCKYQRLADYHPGHQWTINKYKKSEKIFGHMSETEILRIK